MSYILEALKKAQAERQLGSAPTIHAMPLQAAPLPPSAGRRMPLWLGLTCAAVAVSFAVGVVDGYNGADVGAFTAPAVLGVVPVTAPPPVVVAPEAPATAMVAPPPLAPVAQPAPPVAAPATPALVRPPVAPVARVAPVAAVAAVPARAAPPVAVAPPAPVREPAKQLAAAPVVEAAAPEENLPFMNQLPEPQRSELPKVTFGGYMYSRNPADRLLLIDRVLRHEGEEVAPGLVLEQLQPKAAVMNYRGTRYRVAY